MATSKVLLVKPVENLGGEGEQVVVKAGYARNFLFPQKKAAFAQTRLFSGMDFAEEGWREKT